MTTSKADGSSANVDDGDWLGYGAYADALWIRTMRALDRDKDGMKPLGDDPLVIGIFGEWGAGKSHLLKLVYRLAQDQSARDIAHRVLMAPTHEKGDLPLTVTVPVMFQPWKYEHEPHLHVPLAIHVADALEDAWKRLPADFEQVKVWVERGSEGAKDVAEKLENAKGWIDKLGKFWVGAKKVVKSDAAQVVAGTVDVLATAVGVPPLLSVGLSKAREHLGDDDDLDAGDRDAKDTASSNQSVKPTTKSRTEQRAQEFSHSEDGLAFYRIHKLMHAMTRPKLSTTLLKTAGLKIADGIEFDLRINFVVFVDDLDRCLPEKAVETLELIKTMFNIESFAFVLALDDEVIERGIGHRYKEYQLVGKKPEMPITGFEYLEKIVHLPFRLPALTREQASAFVRRYEQDIEPDPLLRWFEPLQQGAVASSKPGRGQGSDGSVIDSAAEPARTMQGPDLLDLALSGFDAYMPRKLIRMVELLHQIAKIAAIRNAPLQLSASGSIDVRVVLALLLVQLFQPELYRILRRREESFPALLAAFAKKDDGTKDGARELYDARVSDIDLWQWAVNSGHTGPRDLWDPQNFDQTYGYAVQQIARVHIADSFERVNAQIIRLPMVAQIIGHRAVNRHVFDVLKLMTALAVSMEATNSDPRRLTFRPYLSLLSQPPPVLVAISGEVVLEGASASGAIGATVAADTRLRFNLRSTSELAQSLLSADTAVQANLASRNELRDGEVLAHGVADALAVELQQMMTDFSGAASDPGATAQSKVNLLNGLQYLAPYVAQGEGADLWKLVADVVNLNHEPNPKLRALWGDVRAKLGCDPRFEPEGLRLAKKDIDDPATAFTTKGDDIPGFALIDARNKPFWFGDGGASSGKPVKLPGLAEPFYIARTLTTVSQYAQFVASKDYASHFEGEGRQWLDGSRHDEFSNDNVKKWLVRRPKEQRNEPFGWKDQLANPLRPVVRVSWFEAQAYVHWLSASLGGHGLHGYRASLPTELQWECAARYAAYGAYSQWRFPWKDGTAADVRGREFALHANVGHRVGEPSTVGLYPKGRSEAGLTDIAGNVSEWMGHAYVEDFDPSKKFELQQATESHALRGGSWNYDPENARCSYRDGDLPEGCYGGVGIRVVLSPVNRVF